MSRTIVATHEEVNWLDENHENLMKGIEVEPNTKYTASLTGDENQVTALNGYLNREGPNAIVWTEDGYQGR